MGSRTESTSGLPRAAALVAILVASVVLAHGVISTGLAGHYEKSGQPDQALRWRAKSPAALTGAAAAAADRDDYPAAAAMARRALGQGALNAPAMRILAFAIAGSGRRDEAAPLMKQAVRLSLRDGPGQAWLLEQSLVAGDYGAAMTHADAIMRRSTAATGGMSLLLGQAIRVEAGRTALARRLARNPPWRGPFLLLLSRNGDIDTTSALFRAMVGTAGPPTVEEVSPFVQRLVATLRFDDARRLWHDLSGGLPPDLALIHDGGFDGHKAPPPLTWQTIRVNGGAAALTGEDDGPLGYLRLRHDGFSSSGVMARQLVFLRPGDYVVSARASVDEPAADGRFRLEVNCTAGPRLGVLNLESRPGPGVSSSMRFTVPAEGCATQWVIFRPNTGDRREPAEMRIDDVRVIPGDEAPDGGRGR